MYWLLPILHFGTHGARWRLPQLLSKRAARGISGSARGIYSLFLMRTKERCLSVFLLHVRPAPADVFFSGSYLNQASTHTKAWTIQRLMDKTNSLLCTKKINDYQRSRPSKHVTCTKMVWVIPTTATSNGAARLCLDCYSPLSKYNEKAEKNLVPNEHT